MSDVQRPASITFADLLEADTSDQALEPRPSDPSDMGIWAVDAVVGRSEQATVYACHNRSAPRIRAALKVAAVGGRFSESGLLQEAQLAARLEHPNIVRVRTVVLDHDPPYIEMALVDGPDLREVLASGGLSHPELVALAAGLVDAVSTMHAAGIHHRDLKPGNVLQGADGPVLIDFGLAQSAADAGTPLQGVQGTVGYLPPEWAPDAVVDGESWDRYALGVVLYEAATGLLAFPLDRQRSRLEQVFAVQAQVKARGALDPGSGVPPLLRGLVLRLTSPDPADRAVDFAQVLSQLRSWELRPPQTLFPDEGSMEALPPDDAAEQSGGGRPWLGAVLAAGAVLLVLGAWWAWQPEAPEYGPGSVVVRLALQTSPVDPGLPVALMLDGEAFELSERPALTVGEHQLEAKVGEDCGAGELPAWCRTATDLLSVQDSSRGHVLHTLSLPVAKPIPVELKVAGAAPVRARVDAGPWQSCSSASCSLQALPGPSRSLTVQAGECPDEPCADACPSGCVEASTAVEVPFAPAEDLTAALRLEPLSVVHSQPPDGSADSVSSPPSSPPSAGPAITVGAFVRWLEANPSFQPGGADAVAHADDNYLKGWVGLEARDSLSGAVIPASMTVDLVSPKIFEAYCEGRGGVLGLGDGPKTGGGAFELRKSESGWMSLDGAGQERPVKLATRSLRHFTVRCRR